MKRFSIVAAVLVAVSLGQGCARGEKAAVTEEATAAPKADDPAARPGVRPEDGAAPDMVDVVPPEQQTDETTDTKPPEKSAMTPGGDPTPGVRDIGSEAEARAAIGTLVRIEGDAEDAKIAGVVVRDDLVVYCLDRRFGWSDKAGSQVTVEGELQYTDRFAAKKMPDGAMRPGTDGSVFVMESCVLQ